MNKNEQVAIELPPLPKNTQFKSCTVRNKKPVSNKYSFKPRRAPVLENYVKQVSWDCHNKTIDLAIEETPGFDAYLWFEGINKRLAEAQKSAFVDLEEDSVSLTMYDKDDLEVRTLKFRGLQLNSHFCTISSGSIIGAFGIDSPDDDCLMHTLTLNYTDCEVSKSNECQPFSMSHPNIDNVLTDYEWQAQQVS